jgi:Asp-tRNA(Asn)/Glu-tRNA(Gln) amidotransferase A subunit family amidase
MEAFAPWPPPLAHMATIGPMARTIEDLALAYNVLKGPDPGSVYTVPSRDVHPETVDVRRVRCAIFTDVDGLPLRAEIRSAVERAAAALEQTGVPVEAAAPPIARAYEVWWAYHTADGNKLLLDALGDGIHLLRERLRSGMCQPFPQRSAAEFFSISVERDTFRVELARFMERYPIIIGPVVGITAFPHGALTVDVDGQEVGLYETVLPVSWVNSAGLPAAVVPAGRDRDGLPIGVQVVGRAFDEETVLAVAGALERELGGFQPPLG